MPVMAVNGLWPWPRPSARKAVPKPHLLSKMNRSCRTQAVESGSGMAWTSAQRLVLVVQIVQCSPHPVWWSHRSRVCVSLEGPATQPASCCKEEHNMSGCKPWTSDQQSHSTLYLQVWMDSFNSLAWLQAMASPYEMLQASARLSCSHVWFVS